MQPKVTLIEWPRWPVETIYYLWEASRTDNPVPTPKEIRARGDREPEFRALVRKTFEQVVGTMVPVAENLWFVFLLENVTISFREQMVRHRIGVKVGERLGVDLFPDLHDSTWWGQSMRALNMGSFFDTGSYRIPDSIAAKFELQDTYQECMCRIQTEYNRLISSGIPAEDAREILPLGITHRISWGLNLSAVQHVVGKRGCWIAQLGVWEPVVRGIVDELATKVDPYFRNMISPPCVKGDEFTGCVFEAINNERILGTDPFPPCALYLSRHKENNENLVPAGMRQRYNKMKTDYARLWGRDIKTGVRT